jgi:uncharacterized membrane protein
MDYITPALIALAIAAIVLLLFYLYVSAVSKVFRTIGLTPGEAGTVILLTLSLGWIPIPFFKYGGWILSISLGGALIPLILCWVLLRSKRVGLAEFWIGVLIVSVCSYFLTRAEEGVGIVADIPWAFIPAIAAGLYSLSAFWMDISRAAPLAYSTGIVGTLIGADVFHLWEVLSFTPPQDGAMLVIGGANIFDMVYITGIVAVAVDLVAFWVIRQQSKYGFGAVVAEFRRGAEGLPYASDQKPAPTLVPDKKGRLREMR